MSLITKVAMVKICECCSRVAFIEYANGVKSPYFATKWRGCQIVDEAREAGILLPEEAEVLSYVIEHAIMTPRNPRYDEWCEEYHAASSDERETMGWFGLEPMAGFRQ